MSNVKELPPAWEAQRLRWAGKPEDGTSSRQIPEPTPLKRIPGQARRRADVVMAEPRSLTKAVIDARAELGSSSRHDVRWTRWFGDELDEIVDDAADEIPNASRAANIIGRLDLRQFHPYMPCAPGNRTNLLPGEDHALYARTLFEVNQGRKARGEASLRVIGQYMDDVTGDGFPSRNTIARCEYVRSQVGGSAFLLLHSAYVEDERAWRGFVLSDDHRLPQLIT